MAHDIHTQKKALFIMRDAAYIHYYQSIIKGLLDRGYHVKALADRKWTNDQELNVFSLFKADHVEFDYGWAIPRESIGRKVLFQTRELLSYRRYLVRGDNRQSRYFKERYKGYLGPKVQMLISTSLGAWLLKRNFCAHVLRFFEYVISPAQKIVEDIQHYAPDVVIASPVNMRFASADLEYLKAAVYLGIPTAVPVISWDNLTTKGIFHIIPDILLVWNDVQQEEALVYQDIPKSRIRIMGAPVFDVWFSHLSLSVSRDDFCYAHGLRSQDPIVLYLGSSAHMAKDETWLVETLRHALDNSDDSRVRSTQIIVRPHPANSRIYERLKIKDIIVLPKEGTLPHSSATLQFFYDTLFFSVCAIDGANTSGIIDSLIAGKSGVVLLTEQYRATQSETIHFSQLITADVLEQAHGAQDFPAILKNLLDGKDSRKEKREVFVAAYIRPRGLDRTAGDAGAEEIDNLVMK